MGDVVFKGATSGQITVSPPAVAGTNTLTLPAATDTLVGKATTDTLTNKTLTSPTITGAVVSSMASSVITASTVKASTSGTSVEFTGIPSWVKRITMMFQGVSTNGTSGILIQIGDGSFIATGYLGSGVLIGASSASSSTATTGWKADDAGAAAATRHGNIVITNITGNTWVMSSVMGRSDTSAFGFGAGSLALTGTLDRVRAVSTNGTDAFDAGNINIFYE